MFHFEHQLIAGRDRFTEPGLIDLDQVVQPLIEVIRRLGDKSQDAGSLRECFDDQHTGHDRRAGKMAGKERLIDRDVLDGREFSARLEFIREHPVDQLKRIAMREHLHDVLRFDG